MSNAQIPTIIGIVAGMIVIGVTVYFIGRFMKGSLKIAVKGNRFRRGDPIEGTLTVTTKKAVGVNRLYVALVGKKLCHMDDSTEWREYHREEYDVDVDGHLHAGFIGTYDFSIDAPTMAELSIPKVGNAFVDTMVKGALAMAQSPAAGRWKWIVIARLETRGVDLAASQRIYVSL